MKPWLTILFTFLIFLYAFNFLALNRQFYTFLHWQMDLPVEAEVLREGRKQVLDFIKDKGSLSPQLFLERERIHLEDIKFFMSIEKLLFLAYVDLFLIFYFFYFFGQHLFKKKKANRPKPWRRTMHEYELSEIIHDASRIGMSLTGIFTFAFLFGFNFLFTRFHEILFTNDFWFLDPQKHLLINILPPEFFLMMLLYFAGLSFTVFGIIYFFTKKTASREAGGLRP